jgi:DNA-binding NarL/FixJ family response regulator
MTARPLRIVIVEDHLMFREIMRKVCVEEFGHDVVGEAEDGSSALSVILSTAPDLVLLDLGLPSMDGFGVIEFLRNAGSKARIIVITSAREPYTLYRVDRAAIDGFVDKSTNSLKHLRDAIAAVGSGRRYFSAAFTRAREARLANPASFDKILSDRERTALGLIGRSLTDHEIAEQLKIAPKTASSFRSKIMLKLNVRGTPKLIRFAIENGFTQMRAPDDGGMARGNRPPDGSFPRSRGKLPGEG